jgi:hypothetical protein
LLLAGRGYVFTLHWSICLVGLLLDGQIQLFKQCVVSLTNLQVGVFKSCPTARGGGKTCALGPQALTLCAACVPLMLLVVSPVPCTYTTRI